jgi:hypothetical protein
MRGGRECNPQPLWAWRCRLLEPDDIADVAATYGGTPRPPSHSELRPLDTAIPKPAALKASVYADQRLLAREFRRPQPAAIPDFVIPKPWKSQESFAIAAEPACSLTQQPAPGGPHYRWTVRVGATEHITLPAPSNPACLSIWAFDRLGRPSA